MFTTICLSVLLFVALVLYFGTLADLRRWRLLENSSNKYAQALADQLAEIREDQERAESFRRREGMAAVPDLYAKKYLDLELSNKRLTAECDKLHMEAAKYMDLYRSEKFKPRQKSR
jgi:hypothetical protein